MLNIHTYQELDPLYKSMLNAYAVLNGGQRPDFLSATDSNAKRPPAETGPTVAATQRLLSRTSQDRYLYIPLRASAQ